jgi:hypothetical protein
MSKKKSVNAATSVAPHGADRAHAAGPHDDHGSRRDDDRSRTNYDGPPIGLATAIGATMPAGTASLGRFGGAKAGNGAQGQNCCEKVLHAFSRSWPQGGTVRNLVTNV